MTNKLRLNIYGDDTDIKNIQSISKDFNRFLYFFSIKNNSCIGLS